MCLEALESLHHSLFINNRRRGEKQLETRTKMFHSNTHTHTHTHAHTHTHTHTHTHSYIGRRSKTVPMLTTPDR